MNADFLDTNVFVYFFDETDERRREIARRLVHEGIESGEACISFQVVQDRSDHLSDGTPRSSSLPIGGAPA